MRYPKRLALPDNVRIRGGNVTIKYGIGGWEHFWGDLYDWAGWIKPQIDAATSLGANCIRIIGGPSTILQGVTTRAVYLSRQKQFIEYCLNQGLYVYGCGGDWNQYSYSSTDWNGAVKNELVAYAAFLHQYPNVIGIDVNQEGFYARPSGWTDQQIHDQNQLWFTAMRAVTDLPLTCSHPTPNTTADSTAWQDSVNAKKMAAYVDFFDFHVYYDAVLADTNPFFSDTVLQVLIGETGSSFADGSTVSAAHYTSIKNLLDFGRFRGAFSWAIGNQDPIPSEDFGMFDSSFLPRTYITNVFQTWTKTSPLMSDFVKDTFRGVSGVLMSAHAIDYGATFLNYGGDPFLDGANRVKTNPGALGYSVYSCTPPSADYAVEAQVTFLDVQTDQNFNISSRIRANGNRYVLNGYYDTGVFKLGLACFVSGATLIGTFVPFDSIGAPLTAGGTYLFRLECAGTTITGFKDGVQFATGTDNEIPEAGWVGFQFAGANTNTTGMRIGTVRAFPIGGGSAPLSITDPTVGTVTSSSIQMLATAAAGGIPGYTYQWYRNNVLVVGATSLTLNDSGLSASTSYSYKIVATDASSATVTSGTVSQSTLGGSGGGGVLIGNRFYEFSPSLSTFVYVPAGVCAEQ